MPDKPTGINGPPASIQPRQNNDSVTRTGRYSSQSVSSHSDINTQVDRTPAKTSDTPLNGRSIRNLNENGNFTDNTNRLRHLILTEQWPGVSSLLDLHINDKEQFAAALQELQAVISGSEQAQSIICNHFAKLEAPEKATILASRLPDDQKEQLQVLSILLQSPDRHDSPIGAVVRDSMDGFIETHQLKKANRQQAIQSMSELVYDMASDRVERLEEELKLSDWAQQVRETQNERTIENNYRKEIAAKS